MKLRQLVTMLAMGQVRPVVRRACGCGCLEDYTASERRVMWPPAPALSARHLHRCQVLEHREAMLEHMPADELNGGKEGLEAVRTRMKPNGLIALNDYIYFAPSDFEKYGVIEAVNEFCLEHDFEMIFFALQPRICNDVVIREMG